MRPFSEPSEKVARLLVGLSCAQEPVPPREATITHTGARFGVTSMTRAATVLSAVRPEACIDSLAGTRHKHPTLKRLFD
jgi:hypothetical protein